jgi:glucoamylase
MPRDIPVGNGKLLICFDLEYCLRELSFPHVGQENHMHGKVCRLGVVGGREIFLGGSGMAQGTLLFA